MATILDKDVTRETTALIDDKQIIITLSHDQRIFLKLKGMRSGGVEVDIKELYETLSGDVKVKKQSGSISFDNRELKTKNNNVMINLNDLRSISNTRGFDYETVVKFDKIITDILKDLNK